MLCSAGGGGGLGACIFVEPGVSFPPLAARGLVQDAAALIPSLLLPFLAKRDLFSSFSALPKPLAGAVAQERVQRYGRDHRSAHPCLASLRP